MNLAEKKIKAQSLGLPLLLLLGVVGHGPVARAQSAGTFTATGNMTTDRHSHTATLLADGRVLIAGGVSAYKSLSSVELYDPRTRTFKATGGMTPRAAHSATLLPNGKVLIAGGYFTPATAYTSLATAELYDPETGRFSATGEMSTPRSGATATLLNNGKVLIAGGFYYPGQSNCCFPIGAELYDPDTGTFTATGDMTSGGADTATLLPNGKVLISKGNLDRLIPASEPASIFTAWPYLTATELYEPSSGKFTFAGYAATNHSGPTATLMMNGKVLIAGGDIGDGDGGSLAAELYDPASGTIARTGNLRVGREQHTATLLPDGSVLFAGGHLVPDLSVTAEIYDPLKEAFSGTTSMPIAHEVHTATLLGDGTVLIAGGVWGNSNAELYTPAAVIPAPLLLSLSGDGRGQGAIWHATTGQAASANNPAVAGEALSMYTTSLADGGVIPPQVSVGGRLAEVLYFGSATGYPGYYQVNFLVPHGVPPGPAVSVRLTYLGRSSNAVTIGVR